LLCWLWAWDVPVCLTVAVVKDGVSVGKDGVAVGKDGVSVGKDRMPVRLRQLLRSQESFDFGERTRRPLFELRRENIEAVVTMGDGRGGHGCRVQCGVGCESAVLIAKLAHVSDFP